MASASGRFELQARIFIDKNQIYYKIVIAIVRLAIKLKHHKKVGFFSM